MYQSIANLRMDYCTIMMNILHIFVYLFQVIPTYNVICLKCTIIHLLVCIEVVILLMHVCLEISTGEIWQSMDSIHRCVDCNRFKSLGQSHGPMQVRICEHPFHTLGIDFVGELPCSPNGNKWILTAVCPFSNYLVAIPARDKTATTAARALFDNVFLMFGFPLKLMSDRGGEWLNAVLDSVKTVIDRAHTNYKLSSLAQWCN